MTRFLAAREDDFRFNKWYDSDDNFFGGRPDVFSESRRMVWDVKPDNLKGVVLGEVQVAYYAYMSGYSPGVADPIFQGQTTLTLPGDLGSYTFRYGLGGLLLYKPNYETTSNAEEFYRSLQRGFKDQAARVLSGPMPPTRDPWPGF
jgi:hypothetical protein